MCGGERGCDLRTVIQVNLAVQKTVEHELSPPSPHTRPTATRHTSTRCTSSQNPKASRFSRHILVISDSVRSIPSESSKSALLSFSSRGFGATCPGDVFARPLLGRLPPSVGGGVAGASGVSYGLTTCACDCCSNTVLISTDADAPAIGSTRLLRARWDKAELVRSHVDDATSAWQLVECCITPM